MANMTQAKEQDMKHEIDNTVQDQDVIVLGTASMETRGEPGGFEGNGHQMIPVISEE
jgi:hypothetical protein